MIDLAKAEAKFKLQNTVDLSKIVEFDGFMAGYSDLALSSSYRTAVSIDISMITPESLIDAFRHVNKDISPWALISEDFGLNLKSKVLVIGPEEIFIDHFSQFRHMTAFTNHHANQVVQFRLACWEGMFESIELIRSHIVDISGAHDVVSRKIALRDGNSVEVLPNGAIVIYKKDEGASYTTSVDEIIGLTNDGIIKCPLSSS